MQGDYQTIGEFNTEFDVELVPDADCLAVYDPQNLMSSYYWSDSPGLTYSVFDNWKHYDNGVKVYYSSAIRWDVLNLKLSDGRLIKNEKT